MEGWQKLVWLGLAMMALIVEGRPNVNSGPSFSLGVRDSFMVAHSFHDHPSFGPAGGLHGATYTCDITFTCPKLVDKTNWVLDIGVVSSILGKVLEKYNFKNLDDMFDDELTTTEFMARQIHIDILERLKEECVNFKGNLCVKLWESHKAWASYSAKV